MHNNNDDENCDKVLSIGNKLNKLQVQNNSIISNYWGSSILIQ